MAEAYIVGAVRTPVGKRNGGLSGVNPVDMAAHVLNELVRRTGVDAAAVDDVVMGCVSQVGPQTLDIARQSWLSAGLPEQVPGVTIDRQCGSSQQAVHFAAQGIMSGTQDLVIAAGVESMSMVPMGSSVALPMNMAAAVRRGLSEASATATREISQFPRGPGLMCEEMGDHPEDQLEDFALESHARAIRAIDNGYFASQITELAGVSADEGVPAPGHVQGEDGRPAAHPRGMGAHRGHRVADLGRVGRTAHRLRGGGAPARAHAQGPDPHARGDRRGPGVHADRADPGGPARRSAGRSWRSTRSRRVRGQRGPSRPVLIAWSADTGASLARTNPNGGAIALGHPLGATGAILMTKLVHELERTGGRYGLQSMCEGGGQANATIIERVA